MAVISATGLAVAAPIHDAAAADDTARLEELYRADPGSVNRGDNLGATPLHHAAQGGCVRAVQWLLDHGADPNARRADGGTALHAAAAAGQVKAAEALVRAGAAVAAKDG
ncbi:MAG TPA: ankyrin repeat domain-containing protein, partial [Armatimonadota bacterium]|nr:ankyrin repeat domain-containing protein [Armatimonadota bacterium]